MESINRQHTELGMLYQMSWIDTRICSDVISLCATSFQWGWHLENSQANPEQVRFCWLRKLLLKPIYGKAPGHAKKMNSFAGKSPWDFYHEYYAIRFAESEYKFNLFSSSQFF